MTKTTALFNFSFFISEEAITLKYHKTLNKKFWKDDELDEAVREKLLEIAAAWQQFARIPSAAVKDIILTGGNANYNYTNNSDLDVHLVVDYDKMDCEKEMVFDYFMAKKSLWASTHSKISVKGFPVELFAENIGTKRHRGQGVYSLTNKEWIQKPAFENLNFKSDPLLKQKVDFYIREIENAVNGKQDADTADELNNKIRTMRGAAIQQAGEFSFENLVFKELRNRGYVEKLSNYLRTKKDKQLSL